MSRVGIVVYAKPSPADSLRDLKVFNSPSGGGGGADYAGQDRPPSNVDP